MSETQTQEAPKPTSTREKIVEKVDSLNEQVGRAKKTAGTLGSIQGVVADFLSPIGPVSLIGLLLFGIATGVSGYFWFGRDRKRLNDEHESGKLSTEDFNEQVKSNKWITVFSYSLISTAILLFFSVGGAMGKNKKKGLLAGNVKALQNVQARVLNLEKDVAALKKAGGLILSPSSAADYYHNATIYARRGERGKAKAAFQRCISHNTKHIDVHYKYIALLKDMEGRNGARGIYAKLKSKYSNNPAVRVGYAMLLDGKAKVDELKKILQAHPKYLPAIAALSETFSSSTLGYNQTTQERQLEARYLKQFTDANQGNTYQNYFFDKDKAQQQIQQISVRNKMYSGKGVLSQMIKNPVNVTVTSTAGGNFTVTFTIMGQAKEIFYKLREDAEFKSTGFSHVKNPATGATMPMYYVITRELRTGANTVWVKYKNAKDVVVGPFKKTVNVKSHGQQTADLFVRYQWSNPIMRRVGVMYLRGWVNIMPMYVGSSKAQMKYCRYSFGSPKLNRTLIRNGRGKSMIRTRLRPGSHTLYVQFQMISGWKSPLLRYNIKVRRVRGMKYFYPAK